MAVKHVGFAQDLPCIKGERKTDTWPCGQSNLAKVASSPRRERIGTPVYPIVPWAAKSVHPKQNLDPFSCFCTAKPRDRQTYTLTDARVHRLQQSASHAFDATWMGKTRKGFRMGCVVPWGSGKTGHHNPGVQQSKTLNSVCPSCVAQVSYSVRGAVRVEHIAGVLSGPTRHVCDALSAAAQHVPRVDGASSQPHRRRTV